MEAIATAFAQGLAQKTGGEFPVIVRGDDSHACENMENTRLKDYDDVYYVLAFSEQSHALCFTGYAPANGASTPNATVLGPMSGKNFGRPLNNPVKVTPLSHSLRIFTDEFLSLLDWHKELKLENKTITASHHFFSSADSQTNEDLTLNLYALRTEVGKKHQAVNHALLWATSVCMGASMLAAGMMWIGFGQFRQYCLLQGLDVDLRTYLHQDLRSIDLLAQATYQRRQGQLHEDIRAESILRRSREETRAKLLRFQDLLPDEQQRSRIQSCLDRDELDEMTVMLYELRDAAVQKTPEERLSLLLESLKSYCTGDDFEDCRSEAFQMLAQMGFREAREFVVNVHNDFRAKAKEATHDDSQEET